MKSMGNVRRYGKTRASDGVACMRDTDHVIYLPDLLAELSAAAGSGIAAAPFIPKVVAERGLPPFSSPLKQYSLRSVIDGRSTTPELSNMLSTQASPSASAVGSEIFAISALLVISIVVLLVLRHYLPLRKTSGYLLLPVYFALGLPASIVLLVPIDLTSSARELDAGAGGIWLPDRVLLVSWRVSYWITFALTWFILPILAEYSDAGYREPLARFKYSLRSNAQYYAIVFGLGIIGLIYVFIKYGFTVDSLRSLLMALSYCWGLVLAIYLMGHGLVTIPRKLFRNSSISGRLRRIQSHAPKVHEKMGEAIEKLENLEAQVAELGRRKTGSAKNFTEWIDELMDASSLPESRPKTLSRRTSAPTINVPIIITERFLADLSRSLDRARHSRIRYVDEWDRLLQEAAATQAILDSKASKQLEIGKSSPSASFLERFTPFTPYTRYIYYVHVVPYGRICFGGLLSLASICIIWSEVVKTAAPQLSVISLTVVRHTASERGQVGFAGQVIAASWIMYMCTAALTSMTEVRVWRGRALVRRNTAYESAFWYSMQVAKLSVPLAYNFMTFLPKGIYQATTFYAFLGALINLTRLGASFDYLFPVFVLVPVCATSFNLYGRVKRLLGFDAGVIDDEEENETGWATGSWREGKDLIDRELGHPTLGHMRSSAATTAPLSDSRLPSSRKPMASSQTTPDSTSTASSAITQPTDPRGTRGAPPPQRDPEDENFLEGFAHRVRNTIDTVQKPKWMQDGIKRPKWMGGDHEGESSRPRTGGRSGSSFLSLFGGRDAGEGRVRI